MLAMIGERSQHTLLNAVLIGLAVLLLLLGDTLGALIIVVLQRGALLGLHALCMIVSKWFLSRRLWQLVAIFGQH